MPFEEKPVNAVPVSHVPQGTRHPVKTGDSWASVAQANGLDPWDLIDFNFPGMKQAKQLDFQRACRNVNWYLREYVGCQTPSPDGRNWAFSSGLTRGQGAWKGGVIYIPTQKPAPAPQAEPTATVYVIGSPSKGQKYHYQFVQAAECLPKDESTIWLVEKTGYEIFGVSLDYITRAAPPGGYGWITPQAPLVGWLNQFKDGAILRLAVFSHGLRGLIALRYGWGDAGAPDYGLSVADAATVNPKVFADDATIRFDSCNGGVADSSGGLSVAQALANRAGIPVVAWTGRTSYADINSGAKCAVRGSGQTKNPFSGETWKEIWSRHKAGGQPELKLFPPQAK